MKLETAFITMIFAVVPAHSETAETKGILTYIAGVLIALLIIGYLVYSFLRPHKY
jgi:hypothetical protein